MNTMLSGLEGLDGDWSALESQFRRRQMSRFPPETLLWLAAVPEWTDRLASAAGFPTGDDSSRLTELFARLRAAGLFDSREDIDTEGNEVMAFWLPASRRAEVGEQLRRTWDNTEILDRLRRLADTLQRLPPQQFYALPSWLQFVERYVVRSSKDRLSTVADPSGTKVLAEVDRLLAESRALDALSLVGTAQALGDVLGEPLASSARRAQWRIDRGYRQALDATSLRYYQPRSGVERSIDDLIRGNGSWWAVHLLGEGGVGKTMAIRDLCSGRFFGRAGIEPLPVARVDFDHLDPRYPQGRPGELLLALLGELTNYSTTRDIERRLRRSDDAITRLHEAVASATTAHLEPELLEAAVGAFADFLDSFGCRIVLVLDTCEELAKLHPPGGRAPAVDQTFWLLEQIHERVPEVRALLAGRRWLVPPPSPDDSSGEPHSDRTGGLFLDPRDYLRVVPVGGFTREQARQYLDRRDRERRLSSQLRLALLERSAGPGGADINPFDLACYCDWALAEPGLDAEELRNAPGDPYVERRIIARLPSSEVRDCLPVAVELGRFDRAMIEPELRRRGIDLDKAFSGLVGQEWVSAVTFEGDLGRPAVIEVDEQLRPRLRAVISAQPAIFPLDRARLGRDLARLVTESPLSELTVEAVEAALRLLPPPDAASMWERLEDRLTHTPGDWSWAGQATARAAAVEAQRAGTEGPTILAAILATQAATVLRQPGRPGARGLWEKVERLAARHPDAATERRLKFRALCFLAGPGDKVGLQGLTQMWREHRGELPAGSILAKIDAITATGAPLLPELTTVLDELCQSADPGIAVSARLARASSLQALGELDAATAEVDWVLHRVEAEPVGLSRWADWEPATGVRDRARLARLTLAAARGERPEDFPLEDWRATALSNTDDIDSERLASAAIMLELCWRQVDPKMLETAVAANTYKPARQPTHTWHNATPMLCAAIAVALAAGGGSAPAAKLLRDRREAALSLAEDPLTIEACDEMLAKLSRAFRTTRLTASIRRIARDGSRAAREHAWSTLALTDGESPASPAEAGDPHIWWRTQIVRPGKRFAVEPPAGEGQTDTEVLEFTLIRDEGRLQPNARASADSVRNSADVARRDVERGLVLVHGEAVNLATALRTEALVDGIRNWSHVLGSLPPRLVADTALAEAELIALRLPEAALRLLHAAFNCADAAGDLILAGRAAVLLVLVTARAGGDLQSVSAAHRNAIRVFPAGAADKSGWSPRRELAQDLLDGLTYSAPPLPASPELDPRPIRAQPRAPATPAQRPEPPAAARQKSRPEPAQAGTPRRPPERPPGQPDSFKLLADLDKSMTKIVVQKTGIPVRATEERAPEPGRKAPARGCFIAIAVSLVLTSLGLFLASQFLATGTFLVVALVVAALCLFPLLAPDVRRSIADALRRYDYHTIGFSSVAGGYRRVPCRLTATSHEVTLKREHWRTTLPRFRRYLVIPLIGRADAPESAERLLGPHADSLIGKRRVLLVRFAARKWPFAWWLWDRQPTLRNNIAAEYQGPPSIRPPGIAEKTDSKARWCAVQHVVGTPVRTHAGWRLRVSTSSSSSSESYVKSGTRTYLGEELLGPDELLARRTALVVLQAEPTDQMPEPLGEQYEGMHALAAELRDGGAGAVLVVPPVPERLAYEIARRILRAMTKHRHETHPVHVLDLADRVRNIIASSESARVLPRASWDVLLLA